FLAPRTAAEGRLSTLPLRGRDGTALSARLVYHDSAGAFLRPGAQHELRGGKRDAGLAEALEDRDVQVAAHDEAVGDLAHIGAQLEFERVFAETQQPGTRLPKLQHIRVGGGAGEQRLLHLLGYAVVVDADLDDDAA